VREFLARPDEFRSLTTGEAFIWSTLGPPVERVDVAQALLPPHVGAAAPGAGVYSLAGSTKLPELGVDRASSTAREESLDDAL
jgi:hypothetical protein